MEREVTGGQEVLTPRIGAEQVRQAAEVLLGGLPSGIRPGELSWETLCWEKETGMFLRRGKLQCRAVFVAQGHEDGEMFLDFILKGVITA